MGPVQVREHDERRRVRDSDLRRTVAGIFEGLGMASDDAYQAADVLVAADLRGVESHGVSNMLEAYVEWLRTGKANPRPAWRVLRSTSATATIDADRGMGLVLAPRGMALAIEKARCTGIGMVSIRNGLHLGMCAYHAMLPVKEDMIGLCMTATGPLLVPTCGREPRLGSNPVSIAAPTSTGPAFVFDASMTTVSGNAVVAAQRRGETLGPGWIADQEGRPVMVETAPDPERIALLPLGSLPEMGSHKGYGLAAGIEVLCSVLTGSGFAARFGFSMANYSLLAIQIDAFTDVEGFKATMDEFVATLRDTPPAPGCERVVVPGERSACEYRYRAKNGIPLDQYVIESIRILCRDLSTQCYL